MKAMNNKLWFSLLHKRPYGGNELAFPVVSEIKGIKELELNTSVILNELKEYLKVKDFDNQFNMTMVKKPNSWKVRSLRVWGVEMYEVQSHFKETLKLLSGIDGVINIGFNILAPNSSINAHCGDTNAIIRCHLGLLIPEENERCALKVKDEVINWQHGKVIGFTDAFDHEAWNKTNQQRIILLFDVLKPEYISQKYKICGVVISSLYVQQIANFIPKLYSVNPIFLYPITYPLSFMMRIMIPVRNYFKK